MHNIQLRVRTRIMYNQEEFIYTEFINNYKDTKEPIVIYGIGVDAGKLIPKISEYNIVGLMDGKQKCGEIYGKPIIDYNEVIDLQVKKIVIVARPAVLGIIYHRIAAFAADNHIFVGDVSGRKLAEQYQSRENDIPYFNKNWREIEQACEKYQIVTFDIFDTLLVRKTMFPKDIFEIVEKCFAHNLWSISDFAKFRQQAEGDCYKDGINPTIYQIYEKIYELTGCSRDILQKYMEQEIVTEKQFLCARKSMLNFFNKIKCEKEIYLISDMYLPSDILEEILWECGYTGYKAIYVSCEHGCSKAEGLFDKFIQEDIQRQSAIHIGDNEVADGQCAAAAGLSYYTIMNKTEMLENSSYSELVDKAKTILDKIVIGLFCNRAFDDPFVLYGTKGKLKVTDHKDMAYLFVAPEIVSFSCWLVQNIISGNCDYVLYPSRDAYVLEKICSNIVKNQKIPHYPNGKYLYVSRRALLAAITYAQEDINYIVSQEYKGTALELFKDRFNVTLPETVSDQFEAIDYAGKYEKVILEKCRKERTNYLNYLQESGVMAKKKLAFIDFVAAGTVQSCLQKILPNEIQGFYFLKRRVEDIDKQKNMHVMSFYASKGDFELEANIYKFYLFFELILTSPEATLNYISDNLEPVFLPEKRTKEEIAIIMEMQEEIIHFALDVSKIHPNILGECITNEVPDVIVGFMGKEYSEILCGAVTSMVLTDEYLARTFNIFE